MLWRSRPRVLISATVAILLLSGCDWMNKKEPPSTRPKLAPRIERATVDRRDCGSQPTYERLKDLVFDAAVRVRSGNSGNLNQLATYSVVRMEDPLVKRRDPALNVTVCTGRFILDLPPGAERAFDGARQLTVDIEYASQAAADGSGFVYGMRGAEPLVYKLAIFDLQAQVSHAAGGPVITFASADPKTIVPAEVPIPPPHNDIRAPASELKAAAEKAVAAPVRTAARALPAKPKAALPALQKSVPTRLAERPVPPKRAAKPAAPPVKLAAAAPRAKANAAPAAKPKAAPIRLAKAATPPKSKARSSAAPVRLAANAPRTRPKAKPSAAPVKLAANAANAPRTKPKAKSSAAPVRLAANAPRTKPKAKPSAAPVKLAANAAIAPRAKPKSAPAKPKSVAPPPEPKAKAAPTRLARATPPPKPAPKAATAPKPQPRAAEPAVQTASAKPKQAPAKPAAQLASAASRAVPSQPKPKAPERPAGTNPSFDCRGAQTSGERLVCASTRLASLDRAMFSLYRSAFGDGDNSTRDRLRRTRERFVAWRDRCANENCLASAYRGRMDEIRDIMSDR